MAIILGGITLNPNMVWVDRHTYSPVLQEVKLTLGGVPVIYSASQSAGRPITLTAYSDQGWLTKTMADAVFALSQSAVQTTITIGAETFNVVFRHHDSPAVTLAPLLPRAVPLPEDYFVGEIKMMTI
jgi:hypothetical protein